MRSIQIRPVTKDHIPWIRKSIRENWGDERIVSRGLVYYPHQLPGFIAILGDGPCGLITYQIDSENCQIISLNSFFPQMGIGTALINHVLRTARNAHCKRLWLITTNDNMHAMRFYQKRGFHFAALHMNAIEESRRIKPEIPLFSEDGIPIRDEIEMEILL